MNVFQRTTPEALKIALVGLRPMSSLIEKELALATGAIKRETVNWVPMWVDWGNAVRSDETSATAVRAISDRFEPLWYVRHDTKRHGFHSTRTLPLEAIDEARRAWDHRRVVRSEWDEVLRVRRELLLGRRKLRVTQQDAFDSALCTIGIQWFLRRTGIGLVPSISGRSAALLMRIEPQLGFVIHQALQREARARGESPEPALQTA